MPTSPKPSTPVSQTPPSTPHTGTWRHPRLDEIVRRQNSSSFDKQNVRRILYNVGGIVAIFYAARKLVEVPPLSWLDSTALKQFTRYSYYLIQFTLLYNIFTASLPLFRQADDLKDIPLTPAQRKLLGLQPVSVAAVSVSEYNTPPKYARTSSPLSRSPSNNDKNTILSSPWNESPITSGLPGSPLSLLGRFGRGSNHRSSFGSSNLSSVSMGSHDMPGTPTPSAPKVGVGVNSKWLYDRGRSSGTSRIYT
ncbi:Nucleoporin POM34 [Golovinomyces cichoracearum]|uniref:Nucleoporin POM34 n=1 Tax=Golovinomyces cichoracearum TaxID=62708 RepID=A0A420I7J1_9PEZI|nr:Nucleoporin POM34 [Golovinomyces cichoracearum]